MGPLVLVLSLVAALSAALSAGKGSAHSAEPDSAGGQSSPQSRTIRLAAVRTVFDGGLFTKLIDDFQKKTGYSVQVYVGRDPYEHAKSEEPTWSSPISGTQASVHLFRTVSDYGRCLSPPM